MAPSFRILPALLCALLARGVAAAPSPSAPKAPAALRNIGGPGDYGLREKVLHQIGIDPDLSKEPIKVILVNGGVVFSGEIRNCTLKRRLLLMAAGIRGVINVTDQMTISRADLSDEAIRKAASGILAGLAESLGAKDLDVRVEDSVVTLSGSVSDLRARVRAEEAVGTILGITRISNRLRPLDAPAGTDDASLSKAVVQYLGDFRQYSFAGEIDVKADKGTIILSGRVPLYLARQQATVMASLVGGVQSVDGRLKVDPSLQMRQAVVRKVP